MNIEAKDYELKMTQSELWSTAFDVLQILNHTIKTHWINHQNSWKENEKPRLERIRQMFYALGRPDIYENIFNDAEKIFKEFNSSKQ